MNIISQKFKLRKYVILEIILLTTFLHCNKNDSIVSYKPPSNGGSGGHLN